ncbi:MAG: cache domain-containing protein, partial [Spirochaetaceae bacterium]|nr:cache domain-containing protein [Spirochaetaceae bacterium]
MAYINARARIRRIIVLFCLLSLIPFLMGAVLFSRTFAAVEREIIEKNAAVLEHSGRLIDQQLRQFDQIVQQIAAMSEVDELLSVIDLFETHNMSRLIEILVSSRFFPYDMTNDLVLAYFLVLRESELVIAPNLLYPLDSFYQYLVSYPSLSLDGFREEFVNPHYAKEFLPVRETRISGKPRRVITFVHSFGAPTNHDFNMLILIDEQSIARLLKGVESGDDGFVAIVDATGHVITVFGNDDPHVLSKALELDPLAPVSYIEFDGKQQLVSRVHAPYAGWDFIASRPVQSIRQEIRFFRTTMFGSIILFAGLAAALAMFLAFRTGKPLLHVVR